jgi:UDP:flavonoid glycosyltransferase YjiC (YdhE family)
MASILIITSHLVGRRRAAAELGRRLAAAGHDIAFAGPEVNREAADAAGLPFAQLPHFALGGPPAAPARGLTAQLPAARRARVTAGIAALDMAPVRALLAGARPDLVLIDFELHPHLITALGMGLRVALFTSMFIGPPGLRAPPLHVGIVPGTGGRGSRARVAADWAGLWAQQSVRRVADRLRTGGGDFRAVLRAYARAEGVDLRRETTGWRWQIPFAWHRLPLMVLQARELDLPAPPSPLIRHLGPMVPRPVRPADGDAVAIAEAARARGSPVVYLGFGTVAPPRGGLVQRLWEAARLLGDWTFVQSAGGLPRAALPPDPPPNVHVVDWVPQPKLLRFVTAAVIHAGVNSVGDCVEAGVPMLCTPFGKDQPGNAARVAYHGLGLIAGADDPPSRMAAELARVASERGFRDRLTSMRAAVSRYAGEGVPEAEVAALLAR